MNELTRAVRDKALKLGLRVFISDEGKGNYGFFCNREGTRLISFWPGTFGGMNFATCHVAKQPSRLGQGQMLAEGLESIKKIHPLNMLERYEIISNNEDVRPKTLKEQLAMYGISSKYLEVYE